ncbi:MAG TPA: hypothetical protein VI316_11160 [Candidatus Dormibacteraeota bacterium]
MVRRIQLPSTAELFDDPRPQPGRHLHDRPAGGREAVQAPTARPRARRPVRAAGAAPEQRLVEVEAGLRDLPIDALIELRDGLEALLAGDRIDETELALLLDPVGRR